MTPSLPPVLGQEGKYSGKTEDSIFKYNLFKYQLYFEKYSKSQFLTNFDQNCPKRGKMEWKGHNDFTGLTKQNNQINLTVFSLAAF